MTSMETIRTFVQDYIRMMAGRPLLGGRSDRASAEVDGRFTAKRFSRGSVGVQTDQFASEQDLDNERAEVAEPLIRN